MNLLPPAHKTEEQVISELVDKFKIAYDLYKHLRTKASILAIVGIAEELQVWGYKALIDSKHKTVGAVNIKTRRIGKLCLKTTMWKVTPIAGPSSSQ